MTVGCYAITASDWKELDYPLDLWLKWNLKIFDEVALVSYGPLNLGHKVPRRPGFTPRELPPEKNESFDWSQKALMQAMHLLKTDWKLCLATDEFVREKPKVSLLDRRFAYLCREHHLWGNLTAEIAGSGPAFMLPPFQKRLHYGNTIAYASNGEMNLPARYAQGLELWHTGYARNPTALSKRLKTKVEIEVKGGIPQNLPVLNFTNQPFDYTDFRRLWPDAFLMPASYYRLPRILLENQERFTWVATWGDAFRTGKTVMSKYAPPGQINPFG